MIKSFLLVSVIFITSQTFSQINGGGLEVDIELEAIAFKYEPSLGLPYVANSKIVPVTHHDFKFEMFFNNNKLLGFRYKQATDYPFVKQYHGFVSGQVYEPHFDSKMFGIFTKLYSDNGSPLGGYSSFGLDFAYIKADAVQEIGSKVFADEEYFDLVFTCAFGGDWLIADHIILGINGSTALPFNGLVGSVLQGSGLFDNTVSRSVTLITELLRVGVTIGFYQGFNRE